MQMKSRYTSRVDRVFVGVITVVVACWIAFFWAIFG